MTDCRRCNKPISQLAVICPECGTVTPIYGLLLFAWICILFTVILFFSRVFLQFHFLGFTGTRVLLVLWGGFVLGIYLSLEKIKLPVIPRLFAETFLVVLWGCFVSLLGFTSVYLMLEARWVVFVLGVSPLFFMAKRVK